MGNLSFKLDDKVVVVTGASRGIGLELAKQLVRQQAKVVICGRKKDGLDAASAELGGSENLLAVQAHIAKENEVDALFDQTLKRFGKLDALINNVGMNILTGLVDAETSAWQKIIDSNLTGTFFCSRAAARIMKAQHSGKIVSISSIAATRSAPGLGIYGIAKAGIEMMTRVLAQELAPYNIQVNAIAPCMVRTTFSQPLWSNPVLYDQIVKAIPMGRIAEPADIAGPALFLISEAAGFITGQTILVDGGAGAV